MCENDLISQKKYCCGCSACMILCPKTAITMIKDKEGFYYPQIDSDKCINCNMCVSVCPIKKN